jgi:predicted ArsR family transcriptional regulator
MSTFQGQHYFGFDDAPAQAHSPTSVAAAKGQTKKNTESQRQRILDLLAARGAMTDEAIGLALGIDLNAVRPRRVKLVADGLVRQAGEGRTAGGNRAVTWGRV